MQLSDSEKRCSFASHCFQCALCSSILFARSRHRPALTSHKVAKAERTRREQDGTAVDHRTTSLLFRTVSSFASHHRHRRRQHLVPVSTVPLHSSLALCKKKKRERFACPRLFPSSSTFASFPLCVSSFLRTPYRLRHNAIQPFLSSSAVSPSLLPTGAEHSLFYSVTQLDKTQKVTRRVLPPPPLSLHLSGRTYPLLAKIAVASSLYYTLPPLVSLHGRQVVHPLVVPCIMTAARPCSFPRCPFTLASSPSSVSSLLLRRQSRGSASAQNGGRQTRRRKAAARPRCASRRQRLCRF